MKYIDLINTALSDEDKKRIENYISDFGVIKEHFIGVEKWLQNWSHSNQKLYRLLGNQLIREYDFNYQKIKETLLSEIENFYQHHPFISDYIYFLTVMNSTEIGKDILPYVNYLQLNKLTSFSNGFDENGNLKDTIKFKINGKKTFQLQKGTKMPKVFYRIIEYFKDYFNFDRRTFEDFKTQYSLILNDSSVKGKMVLSIHPLDYLTMSDNNSNWTSCMSWTEKGCYHLGTVEMMNSNNTLVAYLKIGNDNFCFDAKKEDANDSTLYTWNDKKWRVLAYVTKDIIMSGKSYPYSNDDFCKYVIEKLKDLAKENLNWDYAFGPELYKDMIHINSLYTMETNKRWISERYTKKHNIIFDTKAMYNDMLNDNLTKYWCYRNKVPQNKVISVSGKATCLCCGESARSLNEREMYYNERYENAENVICYDCLDKYFKCELCNNGLTDLLSGLHSIYSERLHKKIKICNNCYNNIMSCPLCGKPFIFHDRYNADAQLLPSIYVFKDEYKNNRPKKVKTVSIYSTLDWLDYEKDFKKENFIKAAPLCACFECLNTIKAERAIRIKIKKFDYVFPYQETNTKDATINAIFDSDLIKYCSIDNISKFQDIEENYNKKIERIF